MILNTHKSVPKLKSQSNSQPPDQLPSNIQSLKTDKHKPTATYKPRRNNNSQMWKQNGR